MGSSSIVYGAASALGVVTPFNLSFLNNTNYAPSRIACQKRLVVKAAEEAAVVEAAGAPAATKPPPVGPKRGAQVKILRKESYWHKNTGSVVAVDQDPNTRYPVVVRFNKVNYANVSTNNYGLDEVEVVG